MPEPAKTPNRLIALITAWRRAIIISLACVAGLTALYAVAGFHLTPRLIAKYAPQYANRELGLDLAIGEIKFNPFLLTLEISDLSLKEKAQPLFSFKRLFVDFAGQSLFSKALTFDDLVVEEPELDLAVEKDERFNLVRIMARLPKEAQPANDKKNGMGLRLKHLKLSGGALRFTDYSAPEPVQLALAPLALELNQFSTIVGEQGAYSLTAALSDGAKLAWQGGIEMKPLTARGRITLSGLKAATITGFLQDKLNTAKPGGELSLAAAYEFSLPSGHKPELVINLENLDLAGLSLGTKNAGQPLLSLKSLKVPGARLELGKREIEITGLDLTDCRLGLKIGPNGRGNWEELIRESPDEPEEPGWLVKFDSLGLSGLDVAFDDESRAAPLSLKALLNMELSETAIDSGRNEASLARLAVRGKSIQLSRGLTGKGAGNRPTEKPGKEEKKEKPPWKLNLDTLAASGIDLGVNDQQGELPAGLGLTGLQLEASGLSLPGDKPIAFSTKSGIAGGGAFEVKGRMERPGGKPGKVEAKIALDRLNLKPLAPIIGKQVALTLVSGAFSANAGLRWLPKEPKSQVKIAGQAKIANLLLNEDDTGDRLLAWKELAAKGLALDLNPNRLEIAELSLIEPGAKIIVFKDKSVNLAKLRRQQEPAKAVKPAGPAAKEENPPFPVEIGSIRLENGVIDFADFSLVLPFAAKIEQSRGVITGVSTRGESLANLRLDGRVGEFGQARAEGSIAPYAPKKFTDIRVIFRNVEMPPLSPYTATFAGRTIEGGKLNLDLGYKIKNSELLGDNSVILEHFTLGERVESPGALKLPYDLAIALLTDSDGKIDLSLPVRGNVDRPEFSYGHLIWQAITTVVKKIVTAPFRALASLFGGGENLDLIIFEPGQAGLNPPEQEKIRKVAKVLEKRPKLKLNIQGGFAPELDGKAMRIAKTRRALAEKLGLKLAADEAPGPPALDQAKTQRALESMADSRLAAFEASYQKETGKKGKRVNPALALLGRASEDRDFYQGLFNYLADNSPLAEKELTELANQRTAAIIKELGERAGVEAARLSAGTPVQQEEKEHGVPAKLELGLR